MRDKQSQNAGTNAPGLHKHRESYSLHEQSKIRTLTCSEAPRSTSLTQARKDAIESWNHAKIKGVVTSKSRLILMTTAPDADDYDYEDDDDEGEDNHRGDDEHDNGYQQR